MKAQLMQLERRAVESERALQSERARSSELHAKSREVRANSNICRDGAGPTCRKRLTNAHLPCSMNGERQKQKRLYNNYGTQ
jgi:hypothetical protein